MKPLITGATGFIGRSFIKAHADKFDHLYLLVRKKNQSLAKELFEKIDNISIVTGDITDRDVLRPADTSKETFPDFDSIIHMAALYDLEANRSDTYLVNTVGTQNITHLANSLDQVQTVHYLSTYAVNQGENRYYTEEEITTLKRCDHYSRSKNYAESYIKKHIQKKLRVYRPGIVIGNSQTGEIDKVDGPYYLVSKILSNYWTWKNLEKIKYVPFPCNGKTIFPIIPVDILITWLGHMILNPRGEGQIKTYHLIPKNQITFKEFMERMFKALDIPISIIPTKFPMSSTIFSMIGIPKELDRYCHTLSTYQCQNKEKDYPELQKIENYGFLEKIFAPKNTRGNVQ